MVAKLRSERMDEERDRKAQEIKLAAMELFARKGYTGTSIGDIAAELGYAKGSLYYYFKSKEEIFSDIVIDTIERLVGDMDGMTDEAAPALEDMGRIIDHFIDEKFEKMGLFQVFHQIQTFFMEVDDPEVRSSMIVRLGGIMERVVRIIVRGMGSGELRQGQPFMLATVFLGLIFGVSFFNAGPPPDVAAKEPFKALVRDVILAGMRAPAGPGVLPGVDGGTGSGGMGRTGGGVAGPGEAAVDGGDGLDGPVGPGRDGLKDEDWV